MMQDIEDIRKITTQFLDAKYKDLNCLGLASKIYTEGLGIKVGYNLFESAKRFTTVWQKDVSDCSPIDVIQPWDLISFKMRYPWVSHIGVALDQSEFIHTGDQTGVTSDRFLRWQKHIFQISRPQLLLSREDTEHINVYKEDQSSISYSTEYVNIHTLESILPKPGGGPAEEFSYAYPGKSLKSYLPERYLDNIEAILNGNKIGRDAWNSRQVGAGDEIVIYSTVGIPAAAIPFILFAVGVGLQIGLQYLFRPKPPNVEDNPASFTLAGAQSKIRGGSPVPIAYGIVRIGIQYVSQFVRYAASYVDDGSPPVGITITNVTGGDGSIDGDVGFDDETSDEGEDAF